MKKWKRLNLRWKLLYLGYFWARTLKTIVIFEISTLKFVKNEFWTHTVTFGIGPAFFKGPSSSFSEGPGPTWAVFWVLFLYLFFETGQSFFYLEKAHKRLGSSKTLTECHCKQNFWMETRKCFKSLNYIFLFLKLENFCHYCCRDTLS